MIVATATSPFRTLRVLEEGNGFFRVADARGVAITTMGAKRDALGVLPIARASRLGLGPALTILREVVENEEAAEAQAANEAALGL